jgi:Pyruvate/2-oxoacid:ferredoxin oxidoreductase delta subunit
MCSYLSPEFLKIFIPLASAVIAWFVNERTKRKWQEYQRKEDRYKELLRAARGFYVQTNDTILKQTFIDQLNLCWLYCPDSVIKKGYAFLNTVHSSKKSTDQEKENALGNFIAAIRADLFSGIIFRRTKLRGQDFQHLQAT